MIKKTYFTLEESPYKERRYVLSIDFEAMPEMSTKGSFNVLFARLVNLRYDQYLRYCRDELEAEIIGKRNYYPIVYFKKNPKTVAFVRLLNTIMNRIVWEREHPDWREHQELLKEKVGDFDVFN